MTDQQSRIISRDDLRKIVPAAFAQGPSDQVSDRYSFISTEKLIDQMEERGWAPVGGNQSKRKNVKDPAHTTHMVIFEKIGSAVVKTVGGLVGRIMAFNNHMGRKALELLGGFLRLICSNGLMVSSGIAESNHFRVHKGDANTGLDVALQGAVMQIESAEAQIDQWRATELSRIDQIEFAGYALSVRYPDRPGKLPVSPLLEARRPEDTGSDLWTVFNRVQENLMIGGGTTNVFHPRRRLRRVTGISSAQRINQGLWALAQRFATGKASR